MSSKATNYLHYDPTTGTITHPGYTPDGTIPADCIQCTAEQAAALDQYQVDVSTTPPTLIPASAAQLLSQAKTAQTGIIKQAYAAAIIADIQFTNAAGVASTYQADDVSQNYLLLAVTGYNKQGSVPSGFYWTDSVNVNQTFTLADLNNLYDAMLARGWSDFQNKKSKIAAIDAAATIADVQALTW